MAAQPRSLAETSITLNDFARYLNRNPITVRRWFDGDEEVVRTPRGSQREQIMIPISHAVIKCKKMGIPEALIQTIESDHRQRIERAVQPVPAAPASPAAAPRKRAKDTKAHKSKKRVKTARAGSAR